MIRGSELYAKRRDAGTCEMQRNKYCRDQVFGNGLNNINAEIDVRTLGCKNEDQWHKIAI
jgi:hypothetical protein